MPSDENTRDDSLMCLEAVPDIGGKEVWFKPIESASICRCRAAPCTTGSAMGAYPIGRSERKSESTAASSTRSSKAMHPPCEGRAAGDGRR